MEASMSLSRARLVYGCSVVIIAALLIATGFPIYIGAAAILIVAAAPFFRVIRCAAEQRGINDYRRLRKEAAHRILSTDQVKPDVREVGK
jgi:hypothetical protein